MCTLIPRCSLYTRRIKVEPKPKYIRYVRQQNWAPGNQNNIIQNPHIACKTDAELVIVGVTLGVTGILLDLIFAFFPLSRGTTPWMQLVVQRRGLHSMADMILGRWDHVPAWLWCLQAVTLIFFKGLVHSADKSDRRHFDLFVVSWNWNFCL